MEVEVRGSEQEQTRGPQTGKSFVFFLKFHYIRLLSYFFLCSVCATKVEKLWSGVSSETIIVSKCILLV